MLLRSAVVRPAVVTALGASCGVVVIEVVRSFPALSPFHSSWESRGLTAIATAVAAAGGYFLRGRTGRNSEDATRTPHALRQQAATMRALTEGTTDAVWAKGRDGVYHLINGAGARMLGLPAAEILGRTDDRFFSAETAAEISARDREALDGGEAVTDTAFTTDSHGVTRTFTTTRSPWSDPNGNVIGLVGVSRDVTDQLRAEEALRAGEQRYRLLVEQSPEAIIVHRDGTLLYVNKTGADLFESGDASSLVGKSLGAFAHPDTLGRLAEAVKARARGEFDSKPAEYRMVTASGATVDVEALSVMVAHDGAPAVQSVLRDVTARRAAEAALLDREARLRLVMQQIPAVLWATDRDARFTSALGAGLAAMGLATGEFVGVRIEDYFGHGDQGAAPVRATHMALLGHSGTFEFEWMGRSLACSVEPLRGNSGEIEGTLGLAVDITDRKLLENQLTHRAFHDPLTGLANRSLFRERVTHALERVERGGEVAVIFLDLNDFKTINDSLGHTEGDNLLEIVAARLLQSVRSDDTVARLGGDEFAILLEALDNPAEAVEVITRIETALAPTIALRGRRVTVSASVGVAHALPGDTADEVLRNADVAMYRAKDSENTRYAVFEPRMHAAVVDRLELEADLRLAVARDELLQVYQPVVSLETGEIQGFEALLRWRHPRRGLLLPAAFIPLAEETGLVLELGRWVVEEACRELHRWHRLGDAGAPGLSRELRMGVNISSQQIQSDTFYGDVQHALESVGVTPNKIVLEITERVMMDRTSDSLQRLHALKELGIQLAIDDFGTGYSSLSYLQRFPIDVLKIDKSFIEGIAGGGSDAALTRTILTLGEMLGLRTLAEGVETPEQCAELRALGCRFAQGYLFSKPLASADVIDWAATYQATWDSSLAAHVRAPDIAQSVRVRTQSAQRSVAV
ncbi:MAG: sensor domain-containing protein [Gemmatimonadaceae bacterium]